MPVSTSPQTGFISFVQPRTLRSASAHCVNASLAVGAGVVAEGSGVGVVAEGSGVGVATESAGFGTSTTGVEALGALEDESVGVASEVWGELHPRIIDAASNTEAFRFFMFHTRGPLEETGSASVRLLALFERRFKTTYSRHGLLSFAFFGLRRSSSRARCQHGLSCSLRSGRAAAAPIPRQYVSVPRP